MEILEQEYRMLPVDKLRPHPYNPNIGDEKALEESVDANGFYGAVTVRTHPDEDGAYQILAGEHRWRLSAKRGKLEIPGIVLLDVDDVQATRILLDDNEVTRRGTYDRDALDKALDSLGDIRDPLFNHILDAAGQAKDDEDAAAAAEDEAAADSEGPKDDADGEYSDDSDVDPGFAQEWGVLVMADSELEQQDIFEQMAKLFGASKLRVVSV